MASPARTTTQFAQAAPSDWGSYVVRCLASSERLFDAAAVVLAIYTADALNLALRGQRTGQSLPDRFFGAAGFALLFMFLLERHGGYRPCLSLLHIRETERVLRVTVQAFLMALVAASLFRIPISRGRVGIVLMLLPLILTLEKWELQKLLRALRGKGYGSRRAVILGTGSTARRLYTSLINSPMFGIEPVAFLEEDASAASTEIYECSYRRKHSAKVLPGPLTSSLLRQLGASVVIVADMALDRDAMLLIKSETAKAGAEVRFAPEEFLDPGQPMDYAEVDGIMLVRPCEDDPRVLYELGKRMLDVALGVIGLVFFLAFFPVFGILVKVSSSGPILFRHQRVGKGGRPFTMYKFRTMYEDAPAYGYSPTEGADTRITPLGRFLRRTSLDELPQVINVLLGQMSIVGPRPEMPFIVEQYTPSQRQRLALKPGMTGLWQISGDRAYSIHQNPECDAYYARHRSIFLDIAIMLHTFLVAARGV